MTKPIYVVYGPDVFLRAEAVRDLLGRECGSSEASLGPTRFEGDRASLADVLDEVRTFSLLGDRRVVVVDDADGFVSKHRHALERYCRERPEVGCLILCCNQFDGRTRLFKAVQKIGELIRCEPPRGQALLGWIATRAQRVYGKTVDAASATRLRELVGDAPGTLDSELSKLSIYADPRGDITTADVEALVGHNRGETVFAVLDAIASGDVRGALHHWERVLATDRAAPGRAIGGLAWGVRRLLDAKRSQMEGTPLAQLARQHWVDPAVLRRRLDRVSVSQLENQLSDLLSADLASKTGLSDVGGAVEKFIIKHTVTEHHAARAGSGGSRCHAGGRG
jgi:DNA polymerase-3 subunit delta